ncbi:hypothetical protein D3C80_1956550 [compost metagenome]
MLQATIVNINRQILTWLVIGHAAAVYRCQYKAGYDLALRLFFHDAEGSQITPAAVTLFRFLINLAFTLNKHVGQHPVGLAPGIKHFLTRA